MRLLISPKLEDGKPNPKAVERLKIVKAFFDEVDMENNDWKTRGEACLEFYKGGKKQWDSAVLTKWAAENKPALTFNEVKPLIRNDSGFMRSNKQSGKIFPRRQGTTVFAQVSTEIIVFFENLSCTDYVYPEVEEVGEIMGKGWMSINRDFSIDVQSGDLTIEEEDPRLISEDPTNKKYDMNKDCRFIWKWKFVFTRDELRMLYPEADLSNINKPDVSFKYMGATGDYLTTKAYLIGECWWIDYKPWKDPDIPADQPQEKRLKRNLNLTTLLFSDIKGSSVAIGQDYDDPFGGFESLQYRARFPLFRFCPEFKMGYVKGELEDLIGPAKEVNIRKSQALHHLNEQVGSGYLVEEESLSEESERALKSGEHNLVIKYKKGSTPPERIKNAELSQGHLVLANDSIVALQRIKGTNPQNIGVMPMRNEDLSGIAMEHRIAQGQVTNLPIFDRFKYTQKILYETMLELIQNTDVLTEDEMLAIVQESNYELFEGLYDGDVESEAAEERTASLMAILKDRKIGRYGVVVDTAPSGETARQANASTLISARKAGINIPDQVIVKYLPISEGDKKEIQTIMQAQAQAQIPPMAQ